MDLFWGCKQTRQGESRPVWVEGDLGFLLAFRLPSHPDTQQSPNRRSLVRCLGGRPSFVANLLTKACFLASVASVPLPNYYPQHISSNVDLSCQYQRTQLRCPIFWPCKTNCRHLSLCHKNADPIMKRILLRPFSSMPLLFATLAPSLLVLAPRTSAQVTVPVYVPGYRAENWNGLAGSVISSVGGLIYNK